jgi:hypothetical protein
MALEGGGVSECVMNVFKRFSHESLERSVAEVLLKEWDPIGVAQAPQAQDEYDGYVGDVCRLLLMRSSTREVFEHLWSLETEHMGLRGNRERTPEIAERLVGMVPASLSEIPCNGPKRLAMGGRSCKGKDADEERQEDPPRASSTSCWRDTRSPRT